MADEPTGAANAAAADTTNAAGSATAAAGAATTAAKAATDAAGKVTQDGDKDKTKTAEESIHNKLGFELRTAQDKLADTNKELSAYKQREEDAKRAAMTEGERLTSERDTAIKERDAARGQVRELHLQGAVIEALANSGALKPAKLYSLLDKSTIKANDETGKPDPRSLESALGKLKADYPEEFGKSPASIDAGATTNGLSPGTYDMNQAMRNRARRWG